MCKVDKQLAGQEILFQILGIISVHYSLLLVLSFSQFKVIPTFTLCFSKILVFYSKCPYILCVQISSRRPERILTK